MSEQKTVSEATKQEIESFITDWLSDNRIPGASLAIVDNGETVYAEGFGARDLATNAPATAKTRYGVASVTKSFTAMAVLQLVDAGHVSLDDPITDYVPYYENLENPPTVHELLSHTSGMPSDGASVALISRLMGGDPVEVPLSSDDDFSRYVRDSLSERASGDRFFYYNTGYTVLGKLVKAVDGREFPRYVNEAILDPIGMDRSILAPDDFEALDNTMTPYREEDDDRVEATFPVKGVGAAGGLVSSVTDLGTYLSFHLDPDEAVLDPTLVAKAKDKHAVRQTYLDGTSQHYGYGWMRRPLLGSDVIEHGGSLGVSTAYLGYLEDTEIGVALACNDSPETHPQYVGPAILAILEDNDPASVTRYYGLKAKAERVSGDYESYHGIRTATVEPNGGTLEISLETALGEQTITAMPETTDHDDLTYYTVTGNSARVPVEFEETDDGFDLYYQRWRMHQQ